MAGHDCRVLLFYFKAQQDNPHAPPPIIIFIFTIIIIIVHRVNTTRALQVFSGGRLLLDFHGTAVIPIIKFI